MSEAPKPDFVQKVLATEIETLLSLPAGSITTETSLPTLGMDSLRFVSLLLTIEQKFGVNLMKSGVAPDDLLTTITFAAVILARRKA